MLSSVSRVLEQENVQLYREKGGIHKDATHNSSAHCLPRSRLPDFGSELTAEKAHDDPDWQHKSRGHVSDDIDNGEIV